MNKKLKILFFCMIVVGGAIQAQTHIPTKSNLLLSLLPIKDSWGLNDIKKSRQDNIIYAPFLPANFYSKQLGFICRQEIKMDKITKIPFRFRLGSVEQCNWLEGKRR